jgi:hypothetical protein
MNRIRIRSLVVRIHGSGFRIKTSRIRNTGTQSFCCRRWSLEWCTIPSWTSCGLPGKGMEPSTMDLRCSSFVVYRYLSGVNFFLKTIEKNTNLIKIKLNLALLTKLSFNFLKYICVLSFRYESLAAQIYQNHY